jgi:pentatricopeptide repeat protein
MKESQVKTDAKRPPRHLRGFICSPRRMLFVCSHIVILYCALLVQPVVSLSQQPAPKRSSQGKSLSRSQSIAPSRNPSEERRQQSLDVGHNPLLSLNLNLDGLAEAQAAERAQELYQRIAALHREGYYPSSPDVVSFNSVLKAWQSNPSRALEFWEQEVDQLSLQNKPNVRSYNTFLLSLANAGLYESAEALLQQMQSPDSAVIPDRISYNTVLLSYLLSPEPTAPARADRLLRDMLTASDHVQPDIVSCNTVIATWAAHPTPRIAARKAEEWLRDIKALPGLKPDVYTYTTVLQAWARCGRSREEGAAVTSQRVGQLLEEMIQVGLQPNRITYTVVMQALCESGRPIAAHAVLRDMLHMAEAHPEVRPDCVTFSALLDGYAKQAARIPTVALAACQSILAQMKKLSATWPDAAPNARTYTSFLSALANSREWEAGALAESCIQEMWEESSCTPSVIHYNAALNVHAKSPRADKSVHAARLWKDMHERGIACDTITYNTLLATVAHVFGSADLKRSGLRMGLQVFQALQDDPDCQPTTLSYHYWFKTVRKLMPPSPARKDLVKQAFRLCCQQGCLNDMVLHYVVQHMVPADELLGKQGSGNNGGEGKKNMSVAGLPTEWSCNSLSMRQGTDRRHWRRAAAGNNDETKIQ